MLKRCSKPPNTICKGTKPSPPDMILADTLPTKQEMERKTKKIQRDSKTCMCSQMSTNSHQTAVPQNLSKEVIMYGNKPRLTASYQPSLGRFLYPMMITETSHMDMN